MADDQPGRLPGRGRARGRGGVSRPLGVAQPGQQEQEQEQIGTAATGVAEQMSQVGIQDPSGAGSSSSTATPLPKQLPPPGTVPAETTQAHQSFLAARDYLRTRPDTLVSKMGAGGTPIGLLGNFFRVQLKKPLEWRLHQYRVDFEPEQDSKFLRKRLLRNLQESKTLPPYIYDGGSFLFSTTKFEVDPLILNSTCKSQDQIDMPHQIMFKHTKGITWNDPEILQFYNILMRQCLEKLKLAMLGRYYYDPNLKKTLSAYRLEIWPGYKTVMRPYESELLINIEMVSKVIRTDTVLQMMTEMRQANREDPRTVISNFFVGSIVITDYNNANYKVAEIAWTKRVTDTFPTKNGDTTYIDYYKTKYGIEIQSHGQPLLIAEPSRKALHRGEPQVIILVPELCRLTGLTDDLRGNFNIMRELKNLLIVEPKVRVKQLKNFMKTLIDNTEIKEELATKWGVRYPSEAMIEINNARVLPGEQIYFGEQKSFQDRQPHDWTVAFRSHKLYNAVPLQKWAVLVTQRDAQHLDQLIKTIQNVSRTMGYVIGQPVRRNVQGANARAFETEIDNLMAEVRGVIDMIFIILPNPDAKTYAAVKTKCAVQYGVLSQCFLSKNAAKANMSVCTKVAIQMCAKQGGEPWTIANPFSKGQVMVVGFDVYHSGGTTEKKKSIGALVATTNPALTRYVSVVMSKQKHELSGSMGPDFLKLLERYKAINGYLPARIIFYRDGVGEGQMGQVKEIEVENIQIALQHRYSQEGLEYPKFTFIVVSKRINARFLTQAETNPPPGTVVDDVVTLPERYDFYLVSQVARQGTVSPTSYNVIYDNTSLPPAKIQIFTYKMCHLYFNWSGTVSVPAPCQYAHKLAYLTGLSLQRPPHENLVGLLHFL